MKKGARVGGRSFVLQARKSEDAAHNDENGGPGRVPKPARFGFTVTKRTGNSVERNRIKRRLREAVRAVAPDHARPGHDYVLIGKREALSADFGSIVAELAKNLDRAHLFNQNAGNRKRGKVTRKGDR